MAAGGGDDGNAAAAAAALAIKAVPLNEIHRQLWTGAICFPIAVFIKKHIYWWVNNNISYKQALGCVPF